MHSLHNWLRSALFGAILILALAATGQAQSSGTLSGKVVNGTAGGPALGTGVAVRLRVFQGDVEVDALETTTGADGSFRFEGLNTDAGLEYWPEAMYLDVLYTTTEPYSFDGSQGVLDVTVTVYEATDDDGTIRLDSVHLIAESFGEVLRISEIQLFGNAGDRTYVGEDGTTVYVPLPENAVGLALQGAESQERFEEVEGGLMDTEPVPPGRETSLVFFSYHLIATGETIPLERRFAYPVTNLNVLVAQPGLALRSDRLESRGLEIFQGRQYEFYGTQNLEAGTPLVAELKPTGETVDSQGTVGGSSGVNQDLGGASTRGNQELIRWLGFALVGLAMIGVVAYSLISRRPASSPASAPNLASDPKARRLLADLADLEEAFEAGQVDIATYEHRRTEIYEALKSS